MNRSLTVAALLMPALVAWGQEPTIGPQVRIDLGGGTADANETTAAANEMDPLRVVAGWNDFRQNMWRSGFSLSFDGGGTWSDFLLRPPPPNQSSVEGDPFTAFDNRTGTLWAGAMSFADNGGIYVARLDPDQPEFNLPVMAELGFVDKGWMAAGPMPGNPDSTRLHIAYSLGVIRSDNMGDNWTDPQSLGSGIGFLPRVGPNGEVYVAYWDFGSGVKLKRSLNGGAFSTHTIATRMDVWGTQDGSRFPGTFRVPTNNYLDVDMNDGTLYSVYFDTTNIVDGNANVDLYFNKSTDQGTSWTTPVVINGDADPPGDQFFPWLEVDDHGRIHIVFLDSRHTAQDDNVFNGMFDAYYTFSADGGDTWSEFRLTPNSWNSAFGWKGIFIGDYLGMAVAGDRVYPIYLDTSNGDADIYTNVIVFSTPGDLDGDGTVGATDLLILLANWGPCDDCDDCTGDIDGNCSVGASDLLILLANWG
ncbi:MAG: sialidase family protein [Phycisphaerales bacterium]